MPRRGEAQAPGRNSCTRLDERCIPASPHLQQTRGMDAESPRDRSVLTPDVDPTAQARPVEPEAPRPNLQRTGEAIRNPRTRSIGVPTLRVLAVLYTLSFARPSLLPVVFALLLSFLFGPLVRALARIHIRPPLGAALVVLALLGI